MRHGVSGQGMIAKRPPALSPQRRPRVALLGLCPVHRYLDQSGFHANALGQLRPAQRSPSPTTRRVRQHEGTLPPHRPVRSFAATAFANRHRSPLVVSGIGDVFPSSRSTARHMYPATSTIASGRRARPVPLALVGRGLYGILMLPKSAPDRDDPDAVAVPPCRTGAEGTREDDNEVTEDVGDMKKATRRGRCFSLAAAEC